jgi:hypothetical protein
MNRDEQYLHVIHEFIAIAGGSSSSVDPSSEISYEHDGMLAHLSLHPHFQQVVVDIEIIQLVEPAADALYLERMVLLHKLNGVTRFTHGASAFISLDNMLVVSRAISLTSLTGQALAEAVAELLQHAADLRSAWGELRQLLSRTIQDGAGQSAAGVSSGIQQFA